MNISYKRQDRADDTGAKDRGDAATDSTESSGMKERQTRKEKERAKKEGQKKRTEEKGDRK
jgi:hypothetical protein